MSEKTPHRGYFNFTTYQYNNTTLYIPEGSKEKYYSGITGGEWSLLY